MKISKKIAAIAVTAALTVAGLSVAQSATAAEIPGATLTITPTSGNVNTDTYFLNSIAADTAAPVGFRALGSTVIYQNGNRIGAVSSSRTTAMPSTAGTNGLDGLTPIFMDRSISPTNNFVSSKLLNDPSLSTLVPGGLVTGQFELRFYYFASNTAPNYNDPYIKLDMTYNATTGAWSVYTPATATTTSLTASAAGTDVTLTATVRDGAATATAATGSVVFREGATTVATVAVASGVASTVLTGVANGAHTYTAEFQPTGTTYAGSTSGSASVFVGAQQESTDIDVTIPGNVGALTLSGTSAAVNMGTATLSGGTLNASGTLVSTVTDTRQLGYAAWSLTGQVGDFTSGANTLDGKYLGWTPSILGTSTAAGSVAGAVVAPATPSVGTGLKTSSVFATGAPNATGPVTNVSALLALAAPSTTPAGAYSATLTVTLV